MKISAEVIWMPERSLCIRWYSADHGLGALHEAQHLGVDEAADEQIGVAEAVEADQRPHPVVGVAGELDHLAAEACSSASAGICSTSMREGEAGTGQDAARAVEDDGLGQRAQGRLGVDHLAQPRSLKSRLALSRLRSAAIASASARMFSLCSCR